ncbi:MAG TPA: putative lipid II flippase FtsW [Thermodesulfobacteriota bacterium]|nr:putative lipid II flippase FtsW [Thermodesulfobacteriota bacterium]
MSKVFQFEGKGYDVVIIVSVVFLSAMGTLMVYSTSSVYALEEFGDPSYFLKRHAVYLLVGFIGMFVLMTLDYRFLRKFVYPAYVVGLLMLVLVLIPGVGQEVGGARRWIDLGPGGFQPSEVAKFFLVLYLAHSITKKRDKMDTFTVGFISHIMIAGAYIIALLLEPDFGMVVILTAMLFGMLFIGEVRILYLVASGAIAVFLLVLAVIDESYRMKRIIAFLNPWEDPLGSGYQAVQSFVAFGLGGVLGAGLGDSTQKLFFLPQAHTDFIFSIIGEELGFIGVLSVIVAFGILIVRGLRVAIRSRDLFGCYLVFGCIMLIALQAGINMAVAVGLFPIKGLTLPFISYGGTSLISSLGAVGIILSVSRRSVG